MQFLRTKLTHHVSPGSPWGEGFWCCFETKCYSIINQVTFDLKAAVFLMSTEQMCVIFCARLLTLFSSTVMWDRWSKQ